MNLNVYSNTYIFNAYYDNLVYALFHASSCGNLFVSLCLVLWPFHMLCYFDFVVNMFRSGVYVAVLGIKKEKMTIEKERGNERMREKKKRRNKANVFIWCSMIIIIYLFIKSAYTERVTDWLTESWEWARVIFHTNVVVPHLSYWHFCWGVYVRLRIQFDRCAFVVVM